LQEGIAAQRLQGFIDHAFAARLVGFRRLRGHASAPDNNTRKSADRFMAFFPNLAVFNPTLICMLFMVKSWYFLPERVMATL
jgi:hypothetical protein